MTFEKKFAEFKEKLAQADVSKLENPFAMQVNMTDEDCGGIFYVAFIGGCLSVEPYDYVDRTSEIIGLSTEIKKVFSARIGLEKALSEGKVIINGTVDDTRALQNALKKPTAKKPAKKAEPKTEKKETKKKPEKKTEKK